jgi:hypothetical protein
MKVSISVDQVTLRWVIKREFRELAATTTVGEVKRNVIPEIY